MSPSFNYDGALKETHGIAMSPYVRTWLDVLHWPSAEQRISYRIVSMVWRCFLGLAPLYLREICCPLHSAMSSRSLRSSQQGLLLVPFARTSAKQSRAFSVVGPSIWNGLPSQLRTLPRAQGRPQAGARGCTCAPLDFAFQFYA